MSWTNSFTAGASLLPAIGALLISVLLLGCGRRAPNPPTSQSGSSSSATSVSPANRSASATPSRIGVEPYSAISPLGSATQRTGPETRPSFQSADSAVQALVEAFFNSSPEAQNETIDSLFALHSREALEGLIFILQCLQPSALKTNICQKLSTIDTRDNREYLMDLMPTADSDTRRALALALGAQADSALVMQLVERFDATSDERVKQSAQLVMSGVSSPDAMETLAAIVTDPLNGMTDPIVAAAAQALAQSASAPSVDTLLQKMNSSADSGGASAIGELISSIASPSAESALVYAASGNKLAANPNVRLAAVRALANFPTPETIEVLRRLEQDPDPVIQAAAKDMVRRMQGERSPQLQ
jgi:HEAT repeat protein